MEITVSLKALRVTNNLSLEDVASKLGITRETYRKKESGESKLTLDEGFALAELFNCSISEIKNCLKS